MPVKKTIAIIDAMEKRGAEIANKLSPGDYRLLLFSNYKTRLTQLLRQLKKNSLNTDADIMDCAKDGCWEADIIILDIIPDTEKDVADKIKEVATQKIVLSISNNEKGNLFPFKTAQQLQSLLPFSKVVAAYNNPQSGETFIAGDDDESVETVSTILKTAGYRIVAGDSLSTIKSL
ncbi:MAG TPA: NADP oxidoreductase [Chitinophagaceae bacterium]|jgi:Predicted dinucleotide-binding enzymes